jgi:hypothetical protein
LSSQVPNCPSALQPCRASGHPGSGFRHPSGVLIRWCRAASAEQSSKAEQASSEQPSSEAAGVLRIWAAEPPSRAAESSEAARTAHEKARAGAVALGRTTPDRRPLLPTLHRFTPRARFLCCSATTAAPPPPPPYASCRALHRSSRRRRAPTTTRYSHPLHSLHVNFGLPRPMESTCHRCTHQPSRSLRCTCCCSGQPCPTPPRRPVSPSRAHLLAAAPLLQLRSTTTAPPRHATAAPLQPAPVTGQPCPCPC